VTQDPTRSVVLHDDTSTTRHTSGLAWDRTHTLDTAIFPAQTMIAIQQFCSHRQRYHTGIGANSSIEKN
jgi:hypothetical protein